MPGTEPLPALLPSTMPHVPAEEMQQLQQAHLEPAVVSVRLNPLKPSDSFAEAVCVPWCEDGRYLDTRPAFTADPLFHAGCYYVQEASSMLLDAALRQLFDREEAIIALDLCASPGGKSTLLSSFLQAESLLISNEVIASRVGMLSENLCKWGRMNNWVTHNDPKSFTPLQGYFDLVLVDAPCSGSGLFRKIPEYANDWNPDMVQLCAQRQQRILHDIDGILAENGVLIYMTCSFCEAENEDIVDYILDQFDVDSVALTMPEAWGVVETQSSRQSGFGYHCYPHKLRGEGFFMACFRNKKNTARPALPETGRKKRPSPEMGVIQQYIDMTGKSVVAQQDLAFVLHESHEAHLQYLSKQLRVVRKGILAGKMIRDELIPDHELALSIDARRDIPAVDVTYDEALSYLRKEALSLQCPSKGWYVVRYKGHHLGWIKNLGSRINNYFPSSYRILNRKISFDEE